MGVPFIASDTTLSKPHPTITSVSDQKGKILSYVYQLGWPRWADFGQNNELKKGPP